MHVYDTATVLDKEQLRDITLDDPELMREILNTLLEDTARHLILLQEAISREDSESSVRLAHYSKGACANVGANAAAAAFLAIEKQAAAGQIDRCRESLQALDHEMDRLRHEAAFVN